MAEATLNETLLSYVARRNQINLQVTQFQNTKTLVSAETADLAEWKNNRYAQLRTECKNIFSMKYQDSTYTYVDYTQIPEYTEEITYIDCFYDAETEDLMSWEGSIDNQITTLSVELKEINAYMDSFKSILNENIKDDYNYAEGM